MKTTVTPHPNQPGWLELGGQRHYFRSKAEQRYAAYLQFLKDHEQIRSWNYECKTFWFEPVSRGTVSYLPDFEITNLDGSVEYHECKGWLDSKSKTKLNRMRIYHPQVKIRVIDSKWFRANGKKLEGLVPGWPKRTHTP